MRYGILGGTFDPPHLGHLALAQEAHARFALDRVWFLPAASPPHKLQSHLSAATDRRAMVELAISGDDRFGLEPVDLERSGPSYTADTLRILRSRWGDAVWIGFIVGWDMLASLPTWREPDAVLSLTDALIAARRPGAPEVEPTLEELERQLPGARAKVALLPGLELAISSSDLRERVAQELPIRYLTPDPVRAYIQSHGLYRAAREGGRRSQS